MAVLSTLALIVLIGGVALALPSIILTLLGFGVTGIAVASIAAAIQSGIGSVIVGSLFAFLQSAGALGIFAAATKVGLGCITLAGVLFAFLT